MIYDKIENAARYRGLNPNLDTALDFLASHDLSALPDGRTDIDGDNVFVSVMNAATGEADGIFEYHRIYADIQVDIQDAEKIVLAETPGETEKEFSGDIGFVRAEESAFVTPSDGSFAVLFPGALHKPAVACGKTREVKKAVFKVRM